MISPDPIKKVFKALAGILELPFARAEQGNKRPSGIFFSYKITTQDEEPSAMTIESFTPVIDDDTKVLHRTECRSELPVSITFFGPAAEYDTVWDKAMQAWKWVKSAEGKTVCHELQVNPLRMSTVQDRTAFLETGFETRLGFDVTFSAIEVTEEVLDAVDIAASISTMQEV